MQFRHPYHEHKPSSSPYGLLINRAKINLMRRLYGCCVPLMRATLLAPLVCSACFAQSVTVRVINGGDGRGLAKQDVAVQYFYENPTKVTPAIHLETDSSGETQFSIPQPVPAHLFVHVTLTSEWHCACGFMGDTPKGIDSGILEDVPTKTKSAPQVRPGYIIIVARPLSFIERLLYPLEKG